MNPSKMKCRTCLQVLQSNCSLSLKMELALGKTVEEILHFFIPVMVKSNIVDDSVCFNCVGIIQAFLNFVEKCVAVENYLRKENIKLTQEQQNAVKESGDNTTVKEVIQNKSVDDQNSNYDLKQKLSEHLSELLDINSDENSTKQRHQPCNKVPVFRRPLKAYSRRCRYSLPKSKEKKRLEVRNLPNPDTTPSLQSNNSPKIGTGKCISLNKISQNLVEEAVNKTSKSFDEDFVSFSSNDMKYTNCPSNPDEFVVVDISENSLKVPNEHPTKAIAAVDSNKDNTSSSHVPTNITEDSSLTTILSNQSLVKTMYPASYNYSLSNRAISVAANDTAIASFFETHSKFNINLTKLHSLQENGPKRIIFLGHTVLPKEYFLSRVSGSKRALPIRIDKSINECPVCKERFNRIVKLERHVALQHKEYPLYKCEKCGAKFHRKYMYKEHLKNYELYGNCDTRKCSICKKMVCKRSYKEHLQTHRIFTCDICKKKFLSLKHFNIHRTKHQSLDVARKQIPKKQFLCPVCGKLMSSATAMRCHMLTHTETRDHLCDKCSKTFKTYHVLAKHLRAVHGDHGDTQRYECSICKTKTKTRSGLRYHMSLKHWNIHSHVCHICGEGFSRSDYFQRHIKRHLFSEKQFAPGSRKYIYTAREMSESPHACKFCDKKFDQVKNLRIHLLQKHIGSGKRPKCQYCDMTFSNVANKLKHEKRHEDPETFKLTCKICYNRFSSENELEIHFLKHNNTRRYECNICGEKFARKHFLEHHKGEKHFSEEDFNKVKEIVLKEGLSDVMIEVVDE